MIFATTQDAPQADPFTTFFGQYGMLIILLALIVFMFWSSRRRSARMKAEQETKQRSMLPGAKVLMQGGLYGTLVSFDADDLSRPAVVELAPGVPIEVHSQAILRVVEPEENTLTEDDFIESAPADAQDDIATPIGDDVADAKPDEDDQPKA
jgi:preprotein translocase subunit YajC